MLSACGAAEFSFCKPSVTKNVLSRGDTKITKTMKQIFGRTALFFLGNLILRFLGLILLPVYVHYLSPDEYGIWGLSNSVGLFLNLMLPFGMLMIGGRFYFDARDELERAVSLGGIFTFLVLFSRAALLFLESFGTLLFMWESRKAMMELI